MTFSTYTIISPNQQFCETNLRQKATEEQQSVMYNPEILISCLLKVRSHIYQMQAVMGTSVFSTKLLMDHWMWFPALSHSLWACSLLHSTRNHTNLCFSVKKRSPLWSGAAISLKKSLPFRWLAICVLSGLYDMGVSRQTYIVVLESTFVSIDWYATVF